MRKIMVLRIRTCRRIISTTTVIRIVKLCLNSMAGCDSAVIGINRVMNVRSIVLMSITICTTRVKPSNMMCIRTTSDHIIRQTVIFVNIAIHNTATIGAHTIYGMHITRNNLRFINRNTLGMRVLCSGRTLDIIIRICNTVNCASARAIIALMIRSICMRIFLLRLA